MRTEIEYIQDGREKALPGFDQLDHPERYLCVKRKEKGGEELDTFDQTCWWRLKQTAAPIIGGKKELQYLPDWGTAQEAL